MKLQFIKILVFLILEFTNSVHPCNEFSEQLKQMNTDLLSSHFTSVDYLAAQQSIVARIISAHNFDVISATSNAILFLKSVKNRSLSRLNRRVDLKQQCWLHNFYQLNELAEYNLSQIINCTIDNINSTVTLSNSYFHSLVNEMVYQSVLGTTNTLYTIGVYNPFSEQWKISKVLEGVVKYSVDGWNGTMSIVDGEVKQIESGTERIFQQLEECGSNVVQTFLKTKTEITDYMNKC
ncbi:hypothetical protein Bhyg_11582 [Pseudolycoriella hygida]|uniref:Uncharacterized protein n=1 Tax=Pseudolycoriella hygida TaxID=35572 RepID=A0A9Q0MX88_9DIPT|nr:hypothetical protein Bhyg_11582 [Pseudolycoriella hygida]